MKGPRDIIQAPLISEKGTLLTESANQVLHTHGYREFFEVAVERGKPVGKLGTKLGDFIRNNTAHLTRAGAR